MNIPGKAPRWLIGSAFGIGFAIFAALGVLIYAAHKEIHGSNRCGMTFMWRKINMLTIKVENNSVSKYGLYRYLEGDNPRFFDRIDETAFPVLFVPGSGGSGNQVRSIASVLQNKTELRKLPYDFHFYAVDFNEELTFLSGSTILRQREFVLKAIGVLLEIYKDLNKLTLIGHSFGGSIVLSLVGGEEIVRQNVDLVLSLAAPIALPPIMMDRAMATFFASMHSDWANRETSNLEDVGVVSWSGGLKDYQVPDRLVNPRNAVKAWHGVFLPSWALEKVEVDTDHLCILWCNQFVRHESRLLQAYAEKSGPEKTGRAIVEEFYASEMKDLSAADGPEMPEITERVRNFLWPWDHEKFAFSSEGGGETTERNFHFLSDLPATVLRLDLTWTGPRCKGPSEVYFRYKNGLKRRAHIPEKGQQMTFHVPQTMSLTEPLAGLLHIKSTTRCSYKAMLSNDLGWGIYMAILMHLTSIPTAILDASLLVSSIRLALDRKLAPATIFKVTNAFLVLKLGIDFAHGMAFRSAIIYLNLFILYFIFVFAIVEPARKYDCTFVGPRGNKAFLMLIFILALANPHIALATTAVWIALISNFGSSLVGGLSGAVILGAIGLAGGIRDQIFALGFGQLNMTIPIPVFVLLFLTKTERVKEIFAASPNAWMILPAAALFMTFISEELPLEIGASFVTVWIYLSQLAQRHSVAPSSEAADNHRPKQWNDKYKKN
ncbi:unnamed protein product, partial [Mesorhabditis spiculigera]